MIARQLGRQIALLTKLSVFLRQRSAVRFGMRCYPTPVKVGHDLNCYKVEVNLATLSFGNITGL